jgi:hypothetical protein
MIASKIEFLRVVKDNLGIVAFESLFLLHFH